MEMKRLALSLSGSLAKNPDALAATAARLSTSQAGGLLDDDDDDTAAGTSTPKVAGIALEALGLDEEGPFVLDAALVNQVPLKMDSGVLVVDFNHEAFSAPDAEEYETDLISAMASLAKQLYEDEGLLVVYVNVHEDGLDEAAKERKGLLEEEIFLKFSDYEICIKDEGTSEAVSEPSWSDMEWELNRLIARATLPRPLVGAGPTDTNTADLTMGRNTFFLSLSFPHIVDAAPYVEKMCADVDAMELRVDLLENRNDRFDVLYEQQQLRAMCRPHAVRAPALPFGGGKVIEDAVPIVYTVRTANQAGTWPDDEEGIKAMFQTLELGLRSGAEVLDIESAWDAQLTDKLLNKAEKRYASQILGSHHVVGTEVSHDEAVDRFVQCRMNGRAHGAKVVLSIDDESKDNMAHEAAIAASKQATDSGIADIPNISLILGEKGQYSRILNPRFTPVTHESLPFTAAPGQLSAAEIMAVRLVMGQVPSQKYAILGHNIAYSVSPQMQGAAFASVGLPHAYGRADVETVEEFVDGPLWNDANFGGCSVTIPHKQSIIPHVDVLTDAAREIGSVNTVIARTNADGTQRVLIGDNTDWRGIYNPLKRRLGEAGNGIALILGGGGTARAAAYAATKLGLERVYYNRTPEKARDLAEEFGGTVVTSLDEAGDGDSLGNSLAESKKKVLVVISTLPAGAKFELPEWTLAGDASSLPVIFDVNYKPYQTNLLTQAESRGCDVVRGSEMLWEQGAGQFELWTSRTAPYGVMKRVVLENCLPENE